jgi:hypothetical protein
MSTGRIPGPPIPPPYARNTFQPYFPQPQLDLSAAQRIAGDVYVAVRTDQVGSVVEAAGPFREEGDAKGYVAEYFGGQGYAVPLRLVFRRM